MPRRFGVIMDEVAFMGIVIAFSGGVLPAIGALMALQERDIAPELTIARGGSALAAGLCACGWRATELARLTHTLEHNRLALLAQLLPTLTEPATALPPRELAALALGESLRGALTPVPAAPDDAIESLLWELTRGTELRDIRMPLALPVRAYRYGHAGYALEPAPRTLTTGAGARYAITLATALRCAAFAPELAGAPTVGGALLTACPDDGGELAAWRQYGRGAPLISIRPEAGAECAHPPTRIDGLSISIPRPGRRDRLRARIDAGYAAVRCRIDELLSFC